MNLQSAADFCPQCNYILELPEVLDIIECNRCSYRCPLSKYEPKYIVTTIKMEQKPWLNLATMNAHQEVAPQSTRATIKMDCPKCNHDTLYFWTMQLRSADEGSTVFYECVKCTHRYQQNN